MASEEVAKLASIKDKLDENDKQAIVKRAQLLKQRQEEDDDPSVLPSVTLDDVPVEINWPESEHLEVSAERQNLLRCAFLPREPMA